MENMLDGQLSGRDAAWMTDIRRTAVDKLLALLTLEDCGPDHFCAPVTREAAPRLFGGQVVAQALDAATRTLGDRAVDQPGRPGAVAHSLHAYFLRAGDPAQPVEFRVLRDFDGGSFANRRVVATQGETPILNLTASFQRREDGLSHGAPLPAVPSPEECPTFAQAVAASGREMPPFMIARLAAFELRPVPPVPAAAPVPVLAAGIPAQYLWFRLGAHEPLDPALARVVLAYISDFALLTASVLPHAIDFFSPRMQAASLDHAVWFHDDPPIGEWLLYTIESPWAGGARGFTRGMVFDTSGRLVASTAQEGLIRVRKKKD